MPCDYCLTMVRLNAKSRPLAATSAAVKLLVKKDHIAWSLDIAFPCLAMTGRCTKCHRCATSDCGIRLPLCGGDEEEDEGVVAGTPVKKEEEEEEEEEAPESSRALKSRPPP